MKTTVGQSREVATYRIDAARTDFIRAWLISRALPSAGRLDGLAYPQAPVDLTERLFTGHFCDLHQDLFNCAPNDVLVYMACRIVCPEAMKLDLCLGYDGPVKVWVDGQEKFHDPNGTNPATMDSVAIRHEASAGTHEVMIALGSNHGRAWGLFLRLKQPDVPNSAHCIVYPAVPARRPADGEQGCSVRVQGDSVLLANGFFAADISLRTATIRSIRNKLVDQAFAVNGDRTGFTAAVDGGEPVTWMAGADAPGDFSVKTAEGPDAASVVFTAKAGDLCVAVSYAIRREHFWLERRLAVEGGTHRLDFDRLVYGRLDVPGIHVRTLELGKFDRPRLLMGEGGGLFGGVGWWFYTVDEEGVYQNAGMRYTVTGRFESEPWYVGVLAPEEGEPYPGWLWYRRFLELRKAAGERQSAWSYWNAGWGQWGIDIDAPSASPYIELARRLGIRSVAFGSGGDGKGIPAYVLLARSSETTRRNMETLQRCGLEGGFLEHGGLGERWADERAIADKLKTLDAYAAAGFGALHFDFFSSADTFTAHRNVARYFRAARERLQYTECHLGMADYGPQFQREVLLNHPADLHGFALASFSSDWATLLGFRHSRAEWQQRYQNLMPESGLYYYVTHYANWGHPRRYTDPEPQQLLYGPSAYCGLAYNFHDAYGFRDAVAAAAAFSPYPVFGHLELRMPERDVSFARAYLQWVADNADVLRRSRICMEDDTGCVVSKLRGGRGVVFVLNYGATERTFRLTLRTGSAQPLSVRPVYPLRRDGAPARDGETFEVKLCGESCAILEFGHALKTLPPENPPGLSLELTGWEQRAEACDAHACVAHVAVPSLPGLSARAGTPDLPQELLCLDQVPTSALALADCAAPEAGAEPVPVSQWLARGPLPDLFLRAYAIREEGRVATWKLAPWAFADRLWLVYCPARPLRLSGPLPTARVNGRAVPMVPRIDYRRGKPGDWTCPLFYADVTDACRPGQDNTVSLSGLGKDEPASVRLLSAFPL